MYYYIFFFIFLSLFSISNFNISNELRNKGLILLFIYLLIFIGLRHQVGGDWETYDIDFYNYIEEFDLYNISYKRDFGYELISYIVYNFNLTIHYVNLICSLIFLFAIFSLGKEYQNYIIIILISFPYLIVVGAMGYTKQSTAFAFIILSFLSIKKDLNLKFLLYSTFAILFHKSAILVIFILLFSKFKYNLKNLILLSVIILLSYFILLSDKSRILSYLQPTAYRSDGVYIRLFINLIPAFIFLYYFKSLNFSLFEKRFIFYNVFLTIICFFYASQFSTFTDRFLFYFAIVQLLVYPKFLELKNNSFILLLLIIIFYLFLLIGWLVFANHSIKWNPYQNLLFVNE